MATHRKPRARMLSTPGPRAAIGVTTAALATVTLLTESASAAPAKPAKPSIKQVQAKVDRLQQQAEAATERYDGAKEEAGKQRDKVDRLMDQVARKTQNVNDARRTLGQYATEQYRNGGMDQTATFLLAKDPQQYLDQSHLMDRMSDTQEHALKTFRTEQSEATKKRAEATESLRQLTATQKKLNKEKKTVQHKLSEAQKLLNSLTAQEKARLAALQKKREQEANRRAAALAAKERAAQHSTGGAQSLPSSSTSTSSRAQRAIQFARAQLGKPYVWGATGPNSYDCSGLTQAAWAAAGVSIPRVTTAQINYGTRISASQLRPGDLVYFYSGITHVGLYIGGGQMIHAPHTGSVVKIAPITEMPISGYSRPA